MMFEKKHSLWKVKVMVFLQSDRFSNKNRRLISHCAFLVFVCSEDVRSANIVAEENDVACLVIDRE